MNFFPSSKISLIITDHSPVTKQAENGERPTYFLGSFNIVFEVASRDFFESPRLVSNASFMRSTSLLAFQGTKGRNNSGSRFIANTIQMKDELAELNQLDYPLT
ncbi:hypothetical protein WA026_000866 [Henosepilachna vigintioctopunctata]|uniref:Uncharacterized protein n=1 Tax=Henosepilachna vigintioctopunctata TaxID=420089 RepID=A0AAW1V0N7_9CUCU